MAEEELDHYNLKLSQRECNVISSNFNAGMNFEDGAPGERVGDAAYLGVGTTDNIIHLRLEKIRRISMAILFLKKVNFVGMRSCKAWRMQIPNAAIISNLMSCLETMEPTDGVDKMFDATLLKTANESLRHESNLHRQSQHQPSGFRNGSRTPSHQ